MAQDNFNNGNTNGNKMPPFNNMPMTEAPRPQQPPKPQNVQAADNKPVNSLDTKNIIIGFLAVLVIGLGAYVMFSNSDKGGKETQPIKNNTTASQQNTSSSSKSGNRSVSPIYMGAVAAVYESSADKEGDYIHSGRLTVDNNFSTCWAEGVPGIGSGENLVYQFNGVYEVRGFEIWAGHHKSRDLYYKNARPRFLRIEDGNGYSETVHLSDHFGVQRINLRSTIRTSSLRLYVVDSYYGNKWQDTCITEIRFF